jgi:hypothetical protein
MNDNQDNNNNEFTDYSNLVGHIKSKFQESETSKIYDEKRWLKSYRNYRNLWS